MIIENRLRPVFLCKKAFELGLKWWYNKQYCKATQLVFEFGRRLCKINYLKVFYVIINFGRENFLPFHHHDYEHVPCALKNRQGLG